MLSVCVTPRRRILIMRRCVWRAKQSECTASCPSAVTGSWIPYSKMKNYYFSRNVLNLIPLHHCYLSWLHKLSELNRWSSDDSSTLDGTTLLPELVNLKYLNCERMKVIQGGKSGLSQVIPMPPEIMMPFWRVPVETAATKMFEDFSPEVVMHYG